MAKFYRHEFRHKVWCASLEQTARETDCDQRLHLAPITIGCKLVRIQRRSTNTFISSIVARIYWFLSFLQSTVDEITQGLRQIGSVELRKIEPARIVGLVAIVRP